MRHDRYLHTEQILGTVAPKYACQSYQRTGRVSRSVVSICSLCLLNWLAEWYFSHDCFAPEDKAVLLQKRHHSSTPALISCMLTSGPPWLPPFLGNQVPLCPVAGWSPGCGYEPPGCQHDDLCGASVRPHAAAADLLQDPSLWSKA